MKSFVKFALLVMAQPLLAQCLSDFLEVRDLVGDSAKLQAAIDLVGARGGGTIWGERGKVYEIKTKGLLINHDHVTLRDMTLKHDPSAPGPLLNWAKNRSTLGGGLLNVHLKGTSNRVDGDGAGVMFGQNKAYKASFFMVDNLVVENFAQYGVAIHNGDFWSVTNVKVLKHGGTLGNHPEPQKVRSVPCIGFVVYPDATSQGGHLRNIYSEISRESEATGAPTAAIKLEGDAGLNASHLTAIRGTEECFVIQSISGRVTNLYLEPSPSFGGRIGLVRGY